MVKVIGDHSTQIAGSQHRHVRPRVVSQHALGSLVAKNSFGTDHVRVKAGPVTIADLTTRAGQNLLYQWLSNENVIGIFLAPPCGTASRARNIKMRKSLKRKFHAMSEPRPLRSNAYPNGIPGIAWLDKLKVSQANKLYHLTSQIVKFCLEKNLLVCVENAQYSLFWATTFWVSVASKMQYTIPHNKHKNQRILMLNTPVMTLFFLAASC